MSADLKGLLLGTPQCNRRRFLKRGKRASDGTLLKPFWCTTCAQFLHAKETCPVAALVSDGPR